MFSFACDSPFSLQAVVPSSMTQDVYSHSNIFKVPVWGSSVLLEGSSSLSKQAPSHEFLGRDGFDYGLPFMELNRA